VPVAVPTGSYEVTARVDLTPLFGVVETTRTVELTRPPADVLDRRLAELSAEKEAVRRTAAYQLRYFPDDGERIVPALLTRLEDEESSVRLAALSVLGSFGDEAAEHVDRYLAILESGKTSYEKASAANLLGRVAPASETVERALRAAAASEDPTVERRAEYALKAYLTRTGAAEQDEPEPKEAREAPPEPVSKKPLWFRIVAGAETTREVLGYADEGNGTGKGYDRTVLDLDGDGTPETTQRFPTEEDPITKERSPVPCVSFEHAGAEWALSPFGLAYVDLEASGDSPFVHTDWSVKAKEFYAWFISGPVRLHSTAEAARDADPIRLGPPFRFEFKTGTQGPKALLEVSIRDGNGCTLRVARDDGEERQISVRLLAGEEQSLSVIGEYG
jgi:hypothetical protein